MIGPLSIGPAQLPISISGYVILYPMSRSLIKDSPPLEWNFEEPGRVLTGTKLFFRLWHRPRPLRRPSAIRPAALLLNHLSLCFLFLRILLRLRRLCVAKIECIQKYVYLYMEYI